MDKLDTLVTDHLIERLLKPERLTKILMSLSLRRAEKSESLNGQLIALQYRRHLVGQIKHTEIPMSGLSIGRQLKFLRQALAHATPL